MVIHRGCVFKQLTTAFKANQEIQSYTYTMGFSVRHLPILGYLALPSVIEACNSYDLFCQLPN